MAVSAAADTESYKQALAAAAPLQRSSYRAVCVRYSKNLPRMFFGEDFANNTDSGLRRRRRSYVNVRFRLRFRFARRSRRFLHNCRIALGLLFAARRIGNSGLFLLTSREQRRAGQNADILIHNSLDDSVTDLIEQS